MEDFVVYAAVVAFEDVLDGREGVERQIDSTQRFGHVGRRTDDLVLRKMRPVDALNCDERSSENKQHED